MCEGERKIGRKREREKTRKNERHGRRNRWHGDRRFPLSIIFTSSVTKLAEVAYFACERAP